MRGSLTLVLIAAFSASAADDLKSLYDAHQWFALRNAVRNNPGAPLLYRAAVACEFHDAAECEKDMQRVAREGSPEARVDAYAFLTMQYGLAGRYRAAVAASAERMKLPRPGSAPDALFSAFARYDDLAVVARRRSTVRGERAAGHLLLPASINGKPARYILDTGANFSMITESEARRLGLRISAAQAGNLGDSTGNGFSLTQVALAQRIDIGGFRLKNVPFMVVRDDLDALTALPPDARGAFGMQVLLALESMRWKSDGAIELGAPSAPLDIGRANLSFDGLGVLAEAAFEGSRLLFVLDTGDSESRLLPRFAAEFADLVRQRGKTAVWNISGAGGTVDTPTTVLSDFPLDVEGLTVSLSSIHLWKGTGAESQHGVIGLDLLDQASEVTLDFRSMRLALTKK